MANTEDKKPTITNAETLARRAWIESALESVRNHLDASTFLPTTLESLGHEPAPASRPLRASQPAQPQLRLVWSAGQDRRRSAR